MNFKKALSLLLVVVMVIGLVPLSAFAASPIDDYSLRLDFVKTSERTYESQDVMRVDFFIKTGTGGDTNATSAALLKYDQDVLTFLNRNGQAQTSTNFSSNVGGASAVANSLYEDPNTLNAFTLNAYADAEGFVRLQQCFYAECLCGCGGLC